MSHLLDDDDDLIPRRERELTLSTGAILGIFFGLVLLCGLFFAFGYNMGSKTRQPQLAATSGDAAEPNTSANFNNFKPSAGSPVGSPPATPASAPASTTPSTPPSATPRATTAPQPAATPTALAPHPAPVSPAVSHPAAEPMPATSPSGSFIVQIAAVSHQEDAELLVSSLRGKGYSVSARSEPQDKLIHIQVGPFADKKTADAMRARLSSDGYNAIVK